ncbi:MAG: hypothetical protein KBS35_00505 [Mycoplasma sp.]|nr:hypothetical protein [Candidatus Hennigella equi]
MNKKKLWFSLCFNIVIVILTIIGLGIAVFDAQTMNTPYAMLLKYFTTLSNLFLFVAAVIMIVYEALLLANKTKLIPNWVSVVKLSATVSTTITFLVVVFFLLPMALTNKEQEYSPAFLFVNSNLIFHVFNPLLGVVGFLLFDNEKKSIKLPQTLFALIFVGCYEIFYTLDVFLKFMPGDGPTAHDWYNFTVFGNQFIPLILILFICLSFLISLLLWLGNKKINLFKKQKRTATK